MNNIFRVALSTKFDESVLDGLLEVINGSQYPEVTVAILLDIYEQPEIPSGFTTEKYSEQFVSFNRLTQTVTYTHTQSIVKPCYFATEEIAHTADEYVDEYRLSEEGRSFRKDFRIEETREQRCSLSSWLHSCKNNR